MDEAERTVFELWGIYNSPKGHEGKYVAARWVIDEKGDFVPGDAGGEYNSLEEARAAVPDGMRQHRYVGPNTTVVELWL